MLTISFFMGYTLVHTLHSLSFDVNFDLSLAQPGFTPQVIAASETVAFVSAPGQNILEVDFLNGGAYSTLSASLNVAVTDMSAMEDKVAALDSEGSLFEYDLSSGSQTVSAESITGPQGYPGDPVIKLQTVALGTYKIWKQISLMCGVVADSWYGYWVFFKEGDNEWRPFDELFAHTKEQAILCEIAQDAFWIVTQSGKLHSYELATHRWNEALATDVVALGAANDGPTKEVYALKKVGDEYTIVWFSYYQGRSSEHKINVALKDIDVADRYVVGLGYDGQIYYTQCLEYVYTKNIDNLGVGMGLNQFVEVGDNFVYYGFALVVICVLVFWVWSSKCGVNNKQYEVIEN